MRVGRYFCTHTRGFVEHARWNGAARHLPRCAQTGARRGRHRASGASRGGAAAVAGRILSRRAE